jgi:hypothetical protein
MTRSKIYFWKLKNLISTCAHGLSGKGHAMFECCPQRKKVMEKKSEKIMRVKKKKKKKKKKGKAQKKNSKKNRPSKKLWGSPYSRP